MIYKIKYIEYFHISPNTADSNAADSVKNNYGERVFPCFRRLPSSVKILPER